MVDPHTSRLCLRDGTHTGAVHGGLQPMGRTHVEEFNGETSAAGGWVDSMLEKGIM